MSPYCPAGRQLGACPAPPFGFCTVPRVLMSVLLCVLGVGASCRAIPPRLAAARPRFAVERLPKCRPIGRQEPKIDGLD